MKRLIIAGCVAAGLACSTTKEATAPAPAPAPQVIVTPPAQPSTVVVTPQPKTIVVPSN